LVARSIRVGSVLIYNIFGADGHTQYSHSFLTLTLKESKAGSVPAPSSPQVYDDLKFAFEDDLNEDEDIKKPHPFLFHHKGLDLDAAGQTAAEDQLIANIKKVHMSLENTDVFKNNKDFHKVGPFTLLPFVGAMDYQHLTEVYDKIKGGDETEKYALKSLLFICLV